MVGDCKGMEEASKTNLKDTELWFCLDVSSNVVLCSPKKISVFQRIKLIVLVLMSLIQVSEASTERNLTFWPLRLDKLAEGDSYQMRLTCYGCGAEDSSTSGYDSILLLRSRDPDVCSVEYPKGTFPDHSQDDQVVLRVGQLETCDGGDSWRLIFNITGQMLGFTKIVAELRFDLDDAVPVLSEEISVSVVRKKTIAVKAFLYSVAILITMAYVNMGCALDLQVVKQTLKMPTGPLIGFLCQFLFMPLIAFSLGFVFPASAGALRLGLFVTGASPGGGASNMWTLIFDGNLNLSVTMTAISTFASLFMMPIWIFTLGTVFFQDGDIVIPYDKIVTSMFCLVIPLTAGILISRFWPRLSDFLVKILKPIALCLIVFLVTFGLWANQYIFRLMTWRVLVVGMGLPWLGFTFGAIASKLTRRSRQDMIAIAIETGIQNTGVSIFLLWFTLDQPLGDMTAVVPIAAATLTPVPLLLALMVNKLRKILNKNTNKKQSHIGSQEDEQEEVLMEKNMQIT